MGLLHCIKLLNACSVPSVMNGTRFTQREKAWCLETNKLYRIKTKLGNCTSNCFVKENMYWDTVQDIHLTRHVPLWLFEQHNNPYYTSLLIFGAGLRESLTPPPGNFSLFHHFCPMSPLLHSQVSSSPAKLLAFTWDLLFAVIQSEACQEVSVLSLWKGLLKAKQFSGLLCLFKLLSSGSGVTCVWGRKKIPQFTRFRPLFGICY